MKSLIIYDTFFGNTEKIAQAIGGALAARGEVQVLKVTDVTAAHLAGVELLVVGSPTRAFRPSPATQAWLKALPAGTLRGVRVAAFDTRIPLETAPGFLKVMIKLFGWAALPIAQGLEKKGGTLAAPPVGFDVVASEGPLKEGEEARAAAWGAGLAG